MGAASEKNVNARVARGFGQEWSSFHQEGTHLARAQREAIFDDCFASFRWHLLPPGGRIGADIGCGTERWGTCAAFEQIRFSDAVGIKSSREMPV